MFFVYFRKQTFIIWYHVSFVIIFFQSEPCLLILWSWASLKQFLLIFFRLFIDLHFFGISYWKYYYFFRDVVFLTFHALCSLSLVSVYLKEESSLSSLNSLCLLWKDHLQFCTRTPAEPGPALVLEECEAASFMSLQWHGPSGMWVTESRRYEVALDLGRWAHTLSLLKNCH